MREAQAIEVPPDGQTRIVVLSCDWAPYRLTWPAWVARYRRHWQGPWLAADFARGGTWPVSAFWCADRAQAWGDFAAECLATIAEPVVLLFMDDMVLTADVDLHELHRLRAEMDAEGADYCRVVPTPECSRPFAHGRSGAHEAGVPYQFSLYPAFHRRAYLMAQARGVRTPWDMETARPIEPAGKHLAVARDNRPLSIAEMLHRSEWTPEGRAIMAELGLPTA